MAAPLSPEEQAALDNKLIATPASMDVSNPGAPTFTPQSGLTLDITDVENAILRAQEELNGPIADELSLQTTVLTYYHNLLRGYETEQRYLTGNYEADQFITTDATDEATNFFNIPGPAGPFNKYFPDQPSYSNLAIQTFPGELYTPDATDPNYISDTHLDNLEAAMLEFQDESVQNGSGTGWTDAEIIAGVVTPLVPADLPQDVINQATFDAQKLAIDTHIANLVIYATTLSDHLETYTSAPFDLENPTAQADAVAFKLIVDTFITYLNTTLSNPYITSVYSNFSVTINPTFKSDRDARIAAIVILKREAEPANPFYNLRQQIGVELADVGEGLVYKKLATEANILQLQDRLAKLQRKLATYQAI